MPAMQKEQMFWLRRNYRISFPVPVRKFDQLRVFAAGFQVLNDGADLPTRQMLFRQIDYEGNGSQ